MRKSFALIFILLLIGILSPLITLNILTTKASYVLWVLDDTRIAGLNGIIEFQSTPSIAFNVTGDGNWTLISGEFNGGFYGFYWNAPTAQWVSDSSRVSGLGDVGDWSKPSIAFNVTSDGNWTLIAGEENGNFNGFYWDGAQWVSDSSKIAGLGDVGMLSAPSIAFDVTGDDNWTLIAGEGDGIFNGYYWNGTQWVSDSSRVSGLGDIGSSSTPSIAFNVTSDGNWTLISGDYGGDFYGFYWNGAQWVSDSSRVLGLGDVGFTSTPSIGFNVTGDGNWTLISGKGITTGDFKGFYIKEVYYEPTIGEFEAPSAVHASEAFFLSCVVSDLDGSATIVNATMEIDDGIILKYDNATDTFSEHQDTNSYCTLSAASSVRTEVNSSSFRLSWRITLSETYPEGYVSVLVSNTKVYDERDSSGTGEKLNLFTFVYTWPTIGDFQAPGWASPTGFEDTDDEWHGEDALYDENTASCATDFSVPAGSWGGSIVLTIGMITSNKVRFWALMSTGQTLIDLDIYRLSGTWDWEDVYEGAYSSREWVEISFTEYNVTKARMRFYNPTANPREHTFYEFDFYDVEETVYHDEYFFLNCTVADLDGSTTIVNATIEIDDDVILKYDNVTDVFSEYQDTNDYCVLDVANSIRTEVSSTSFKLSWKIKLAWTYPEGSVSVIVTNTKVYDSEGASGSNSHSDLFYFDKKHTLNLRTVDNENNTLTEATVYMNNGTQHSKTVDSLGWANWTDITSSTVNVSATWYSYTVNQTFTITMDAHKTVNVTCKCYPLVLDDTRYWIAGNATVSSYSWNTTTKKSVIAFTGSTANYTLKSSASSKPTYILNCTFDIDTDWTTYLTLLHYGNRTVTIAYPNWVSTRIHRTDHIITSSYWGEAEKLYIILNGMSGENGTLEVYCGSRGPPTATAGLTDTVYFSSTTILAGTYTFTSTTTAMIDWTTEEGGHGGTTPPGPSIFLTAPNVDLGSVQQGTTRTFNVTVKWTGGISVTIADVTFTGEGSEWLKCTLDMPKTFTRSAIETEGTANIPVTLKPSGQARLGSYKVTIEYTVQVGTSTYKTTAQILFTVTSTPLAPTGVPELVSILLLVSLVGIVFISIKKK